MRVIALLDSSSKAPRGAYEHRVLMLLEGARQRGDDTETLYLQDRGRLRPTFARTGNGRHFREELLRADVIHAANCVACAAAVKAVGGRVPVLFDVHGDVPAETRLSWSARRTRSAFIDLLTLPFVDRRARAGASAFLVVSTPSKEDYLRFGVPAERLFLVRNGVDLDLFSATPPPEDAPPRIGYAGAMQSWQGVPQLLEAIALHRADSLRFRVIGFRPETRDLKREFERRCGDRVELFDAMPQAEMIERLRECHVLVIPRRPHQAVRVAMPTKFGEYAALGRPILVTDADETATFVREHDCGWVAEPSPEGLVDAFGRIAGASGLAEMGARARRLAEEMFSWDLLRRQYLEALNTTAARRST